MIDGAINVFDGYKAPSLLEVMDTKLTDGISSLGTTGIFKGVKYPTCVNENERRNCLLN
jgi:hypothetical protein